MSKMTFQCLTPQFDLFNLINESTDEEIVMAATQVEKESLTTTKVTTSTTSTTLVKKSPKKLPTFPTFTGGKIENIHIHFHNN